MKKFVLFVAVVFSCNLLWAQDAEEAQGFQKEKLFAGGNFGLSFGRYTLVNVSPQIGYRFNRFLASGLGLNLVYASQKEKDVYGNNFSKTSQWVTGLNMFARFYPTEKFLIQLQPEANYTFGNIKYYQPTETKYKLNAEIVPSLLVGGGLVVPSQSGAFITTVMYDILQRSNSPYGNRPIVNVGYNVNF
ncbi:MAG: hypothetical protein EOO10_10160 [Chitinophagaceae bacterium]|nr:MAG: hypothetical protein EOO10_10160 [Chitinophagaceae bacterium]